MKNRKKEYKVCFILNAISSFLFAFTGIMMLIDNVKNMTGITNIGLSVTFGSLSYLYFKKYKEEK